MPTKKTKVSRTAPKKGSGFQFRWWMALILIGVVAVIGILILRFSNAAAGSYTWYYNTPLSTAVLPGFANAKAVVQADESFVQVVGGEPNQSGATIRVRWQINNGNKPTGSFRGEVYIDGQPVYNEVFVVGQNERKWIESRDIDVAAGSNLTYKAAAESGTPTLEQITRYTINSQSFAVGGVPNTGANPGGGGTPTTTQPVRLGSCGQPLPQGESGNTPQKCNNAPSAPKPQPVYSGVVNIKVGGYSADIASSCIPQSGQFPQVCPNYGQWHFINGIGDQAKMRAQGVGSVQDIGAWQLNSNGNICGVQSNIELSLPWSGHNGGLYVNTCDFWLKTLNYQYPPCDAYNSSCDDANWTTWNSVPDTVWTYRKNNFNTVCYTRITQSNGQHKYTNARFCPSFDSGNFRLKLPSAGKFSWLNQFVPPGAPTYNPIYPQRDDPVIQNCSAQFKVQGGCPLQKNTIKIASDWLGIPSPNGNKKICVYTAGLSNPSALNGKLAIKITAANSRVIGILKPTYQPVLSGDGKSYQAYCQDLKGKADYKFADIYVEGSEFGMPAGAENARAVEYWSWPQ